MNKNDANRKRKHFVSLRLDDREYNKLKEWSAATNRTMSDYLRELLEDNQPIEFPPIEYQEVLRELRKIGINLNQLASKAHDFAKKHPGNAVTRRYQCCFWLMGAFAFLLTDFYLDFNNIIPDALAAILLIAGIFLSDLSRNQNRNRAEHCRQNQHNTDDTQSNLISDLPDIVIACGNNKRHAVCQLF